MPKTAAELTELYRDAAQACMRQMDRTQDVQERQEWLTTAEGFFKLSNMFAEDMAYEKWLAAQEQEKE